MQWKASSLLTEGYTGTQCPPIMEVDDLTGHLTTEEKRALMIELVPHSLLQHKLYLVIHTDRAPQQTKL